MRELETAAGVGRNPGRRFGREHCDKTAGYRIGGLVDFASRENASIGWRCVAHTHRPSLVSALTIGYVNDFVRKNWGRLGAGGDVTGYLVPDNLSESYGSPVSFHVFLRYRGSFR